MNDGRITVIIPVYNVEKYLRKCVDSVLAQTYTNLEVILIDDGSPDNCPAICDEYAAKDERVKVIHQQNAGVSAARNAGLDAATGDYIGFVDSDDWIEPDMYETLFKMTVENCVDIAYIDNVKERNDSSTQVMNTDEVKVFSRNETLSLMFAGETFHGLVSLYIAKRKLLDGLRFETDISVAEDFLMAVQLLVQTARVAYKPYYCYHYRIREESACHCNNRSSFWTYLLAYDRIDAIVRNEVPEALTDFSTRCINEDLTQALQAFIKGCLNRANYQLLRNHIRKYNNKKAIKGLPIKKMIGYVAFIAGDIPFRIAARLFSICGGV